MKKIPMIVLHPFTNATLFFIAGTFIFIDQGVFGYSADVIDATLALIWGLCWGIKAIHNLQFRSTLLQRAIQHPTSTLSATLKEPVLGLEHSSHSVINGVLTTTTALSALAMDGYRMTQEVNPPHIERLVGSLLWLQVGFIEIYMAEKHEREEKKHPTAVIRPCGVPPAQMYAFITFLYTLAGVSYAAALWSDKENSPLSDPHSGWIKAVPNTCWLLAASNRSWWAVRSMKETHPPQAIESATCEMKQMNSDGLPELTP